MARWHDAERWAALKDGTACPICSDPTRDGKPYGVIAELRGAYVTTEEHAPMRGYCCLVFKRHAVELHDLAPAEAADLMADMQVVSAALSRVLQPAKINIEMHGNSLPHLHLHFYPRFPGDTFDKGGPIDWKKTVQPVYQEGEFDGFVRAMQEVLMANRAERTT